MSGQIFPDLPGLTWTVTWQPTFKTKIQTAISGAEYRTSLMANPIYELSLSYEFLRHGSRQELRQLVGFFLARRGSYDNFLYRHLDDCTVVDQVIGVGDGHTQSFQLVRSFGSEFVEPVQNIDAITAVKVAGVVRAAGAYTVSPTGMVKFVVAPAAGSITWTGSYFYRVRFSADEQEFEKFMKDLWTAKKVQLTGSLGMRI